jgi:hypothetical protein
LGIFPGRVIRARLDSRCQFFMPAESGVGPRPGFDEKIVVVFSSYRTADQPGSESSSAEDSADRFAAGGCKIGLSGSL